MQNLNMFLILMVNLIWLSLAAGRLRVPLPILLLVAGLSIGFFSDHPLININPQVIFLIFLPPLLFEAAHNISWHQFKAWRRPIFILAIGLVFFTAFCVAAAAHYLIPGFTWSLGFLLGAIIAPPDSVAATSATKNLALPRPLITILEGESLVNDASSLIIYQYALLAVLSGEFHLVAAAIKFSWVSSGGIALGIFLGFILVWLLRRISESTLATIVSLLVPTMTYVIAAKLHVSGVLAVVSCGLYASWYSSTAISFQTRFKIAEFWEVMIFILNGLIFLLIGLQLPALVSNFSSSEIISLIIKGLLISGVVICARMFWVLVLGSISLYRKSHLHRGKEIILNLQTFKGLIILSWAGMRGVVSLAAAMAIPLTTANGAAFPLRNDILLITFVVILVTLMLHSLSLPLLVRSLKVEVPKTLIEENEKALREELHASTLDFIEMNLVTKYEAGVIEKIQNKLKRELNYRQQGRNSSQHVQTKIFAGLIEVIEYQRQFLDQLHRANRYETALIRKLQEDIDVMNFSVHNKLR